MMVSDAAARALSAARASNQQCAAVSANFCAARAGRNFFCSRTMRVRITA